MSEFILTYNDKAESIYVNFARYVLTDSWIKQQIDIMHKESQFKEAGRVLGLLHPFIEDYQDIMISLRKANYLDEKIIMMNVGRSNIIDLGRNLYELKNFYDLDKVRARLQSKDNYEDMCWELEVMQVLLYTGFEAIFQQEGETESCDILAVLGEDLVAVECKNKHIEDKEFSQNHAFAHYLGDKILKHLQNSEPKHDIRITIEGIGKIEDAKLILNTIKQMIIQKVPMKKLDSKYKIEFIDEYRGVNTGFIMVQGKEQICNASRIAVNIKDIYDNIRYGSENKDRIFFKIKPPNEKLRNLNSLLNKANRQVTGLGGCIFLKVPYYAFEDSVIEVKKILSQHYTNISAVKIVAFNKTYVENTGVREERKENFIKNNNAEYPLNDKICEVLSKPIMFNKYKK